MDTISKNTLIELLKQAQGKAVSIYMPTFVSAREARQNPIRLKNLINQTRDQLLESGMGKGKIDTYLAPMIDLVDDQAFWQEQNEGLALFLDANELKVFRLPKRFEEVAVVGDNFHITPLVPIYEGNGQYFLLSLNQNRPQIFQGSKFKLMKIEELDLPESLQNMFDQYYEFHSHLQFHNKSGNPNTAISGDRGALFFGQGGDDIDKKEEIKNFFHRFDEALVDYLDSEETPLVLAGVGYLHPLYKEVNSYPNLVDEGITKDVERLPVEELHELAWEIVNEKYQTDVEQALGVYHNLQNQDGEITNDIKEIVSAAHFKRIHTLFVAENIHVWGKFNTEENTLVIDEGPTSENQDLLNVAAAKTLVNGGNVLVLSQEKIPGESEAAAILRY